jgi:L-threonylcarbamoyladenylate synthase
LSARLSGDAAGIARAIKILDEGGLVAIPTETVYGLAADAANADAVARVFAAKGRPAFNPLIAHVRDAVMAGELVAVEPLARELMARFWPGPLTLVLPVRSDAPVAALARAGLRTLAVRAPAHPVAQAVIAGLGRAVVAPSANVSGGLSPTRAEHVTLDVPVLDGGPCRWGVESTIVGVANGRATLLRPGASAASALGVPLDMRADGEGIVAPGQMLSHYAPRQPVRLNAVAREGDEYLVGFAAVAGDETLSAHGDVVEAAARLFDALHRAQASGRARIAVAPVPEVGLGVAINDRLRRAAAPR